MSAPSTFGSHPSHRDLSGGAVAAKSAALMPTLDALATDYYPPIVLFGFLIGEIVSQLVLVSQFFAPARVAVRTAAFVGNLVYLFVLQRRGGKRHPAWPIAIISLVVVSASLMHPDTSNAWAGVASVLLHAAVLAPIFWVPR